MKMAVFTSLVCLVACTATSALHAIDFDFNARNLSAPVFDPDGRLIRRLVADTASGPSSAPTLTHGHIDFFAADVTEPAGVLSFDRAVYHRSDDLVTGDDLVKLVSRAETVTGRGYDCRPKAGFLTLKSDVLYESAKVRLTGSRGDLRFDPKARDRDTMVREAVVTGNVVVVPAPGITTEFDRAESKWARYDAAAQKVYLQAPVTIWRHGEKGVMNVAAGMFEINLLKPPSAPSTAPAAAQSTLLR